jgi:predicted anti-sigma-YlaC factor YlaD
MKGCPEFEVSIQLYVDGELTGEEHDDLLFHVKSCSFCREAMQEAESFSQLIRAARPAVVAPDSLRAAVLRQMQQAATMIQAAVAAHQELEQHAVPLDITSDSSQ